MTKKKPVFWSRYFKQHVGSQWVVGKLIWLISFMLSGSEHMCFDKHTHILNLPSILTYLNSEWSCECVPNTVGRKREQSNEQKIRERSGKEVCTFVKTKYLFKCHCSVQVIDVRKEHSEKRSAQGYVKSFSWALILHIICKTLNTSSLLYWSKQQIVNYFQGHHIHFS